MCLFFLCNCTKLKALIDHFASFSSSMSSSICMKSYLSHSAYGLTSTYPVQHWYQVLLLACPLHDYLTCFHTGSEEISPSALIFSRNAAVMGKYLKKFCPFQHYEQHFFKSFSKLAKQFCSFRKISEVATSDGWVRILLQNMHAFNHLAWYMYNLIS